MLKTKSIHSDAYIIGSRGTYDLNVIFFNITDTTAYIHANIRNIYMKPIYRVKFITILNPINTSISPKPKGFFITLLNAKINRDNPIPTIKALSGIVSLINNITKKYMTESIKNIFTNTCGIPLYILSKYENEKKNISTTYRVGDSMK